MIITCKACSTSFNLDDKMLKPTGSKVRCSVCANVFTVFPEQAPIDDSTDAQTEPDAVPPAVQTEEDGADASMDTVVEASDDDIADEVDDAVSQALDEDLGDLSLNPDDTDDDGVTMIADLDGDTLGLDLASESDDDDDLSATLLADLDDDGLDLAADEKPDDDQTVVVDLDADDLDLDLPVEIDDDDDSVTMLITDLDDDETGDLGDNFSLELDDDLGLADASPEAVIEAEDDLELSLDLELDDDTLSIEATDSESDDTTLDDLSLDLDLDADDDDGTIPASAAPSVFEDDLDMSSLDTVFDERDDDTTVPSAAEDDDDLTELVLEMEDKPSADKASDGDAADETLADLELELDENEQTGPIGDDDADGELDLSEIEKMLEEPKSGGQSLTVPEQDLDLDIDADLESEKWMSESGNDQLVADEELDLSELEQALDDVDTDAQEDITEEPELELDLSEDSFSEDGSAVKATETVAMEGDLNFDLSDFEEDGPGKASNEPSFDEPGDMQLEFESDDERQEDLLAADEGLEETVAIGEQAAPPVPEKEIVEESVAAPPKPPKPKPVKKGTSKSLVWVLILIVLGGAGYGAYYLSITGTIQIPFITDFFKPKVQDPGNLKMTTTDINSRFIDNANVGKLFVITGKVKNTYDENRGMVTIVGKIYSSGKVLVHEETIYCGNVMSDLELANLEWNKIQDRLANRLGDDRSNVKIEPGKSIPFMVVFRELPNDLEEFTIEVIGSTPLN